MILITSPHHFHQYNLHQYQFPNLRLSFGKFTNGLRNFSKFAKSYKLTPKKLSIVKIRDITHLFAIGTPYLLMLSTLYLFGFWSTFKLNIFEFLEWSHIALLAIQQLMSLIGGFLLAFFAGYLTSKKNPFDVRDTSDKPTFLKKNIDNWDSYKKKGEWYILGGLVLTTIILAVAHFYFPLYVQLLIVSLMVGPLLGIFLARTSLLSDVIQREIRILVLFIIGFLPLFALAHGSWDAHSKTQSSITQVYINEKFYPNYAYIGYAGSYYYLYNLDDETVLGIRETEVKTIKFADKKDVNEM